LDVAEVCLGHMGHARGAAAVRIAKAEIAELEARVASVCVCERNILGRNNILSCSCL
jgi:hypothetical protein